MEAKSKLGQLSNPSTSRVQGGILKSYLTLNNKNITSNLKTTSGNSGQIGQSGQLSHREIKPSVKIGSNYSSNSNQISSILKTGTSKKNVTLSGKIEVTSSNNQTIKKIEKSSAENQIKDQNSLNIKNSDKNQISQITQNLKLKEKETKTNLAYTATQIIGSGSFGVVYQAINQETNEIVAIKKVFQDPRYKNRELEIMKQLNHQNVVKFITAFYSKDEKKDEVYLNAVMEYVPDSLSKVIRSYFKNKTSFPAILVKVYAFQMFKALEYIHSMGICHRDIKPQNILVDPSTHMLKICDFGSAKKLVKGEPNVAYICSRYYRAPELIFGATEYNNQIDVWSIGCVIVEMVLGQPLFPGESAIDQLVEIIKILGTPTKNQILIMNPNYNEIKFPIIKQYPWNKYFKSKTVSEEFIDFVSKVLVYEPNIRLTPSQALEHPFFDELKLGKKVYLPNGVSLTPEFFN
jgi:glycogen synthase kinase 3 beta